jgi:hypothetical protein
LLAPNHPATRVVLSAAVYSVPDASPVLAVSDPMALASKSVPLVEHPALPAQAVVTPPEPSAASAFQQGSPDPAWALLLVPSIQAALPEAME